MTKIFTITLILMAVAAPAFSQLGAQKASIPFAFTAGSTSFPAGEYQIYPGPSSETLTIRNVETGKSAAFIAIGSDYNPAWGASLFFRLNEAEWVLSSVRMGGLEKNLLSSSKSSELKYASVRTVRIRS